MSKIKAFFKSLDRKHYVAWAITVALVALAIFRFPMAFYRTVEAVRDLALSIAYYFTELLGFEGVITPTVTEFSKVPLPEIDWLPASWEEFKLFFSEYIDAVFTMDNFKEYLFFLADKLSLWSRVLLLVLPFFLVLGILFYRGLYKHNTDHGKETRVLVRGKRLYDRLCRPVGRAVRSFCAFVNDRRKYLWLWGLTLAYGFQLVAVAICALAYYLYFVMAFDFVSLYIQLYKLVADLLPALIFIPKIFVVIGAVALLAYFARRYGYDVLRAREAHNAAFVKELPVFTVVYGEMNAGKTAMITDVSLTASANYRRMAYEVILECDMCFPYFPWILFEKELRRAIAYRKVYDRYSTKRWVRKKRDRFKKSSCREKIFGYDYERYGMDYDNKLKIESIWETLEDYACAFLVYITQSSLIFANYSIRVDEVCMDKGNFPVWDLDFFSKDARYRDAYSRHCHILDFDMLRLGKLVLEANLNAFVLGYGVVVISEIDKERKNTLELRETKANAEETNQKNDLFNATLKMWRHNVVIRNRVFGMIIADLQRPESLGADARELGDVVFIDQKTDFDPVLPFWSPFYSFVMIERAIFSSFKGFYETYRLERGDYTLPYHCFKAVTEKMKHHYDNTCNIFGSRKLTLLSESGRMDGQPVKKRYYMQKFKCFADRYSTDCQSGIFERRASFNHLFYDDLREYAARVATCEELDAQNSYFQRDVSLFSSLNV